MLNVQQVRLRFISARLLTSVPSISKGLRKGASTVPLFSKALAGGYPFRCCAQINPQRIISDKDVGGSTQQQVFREKNSYVFCQAEK